MALSKITVDVENISALDDEPNIDNGLSADQLKAKFDKAGTDIKAGVNKLVDELSSTTAGREGASQIGSSALKIGDLSENNVQAKLEILQSQVDDLKSGELIDGSIATSKIADSAITTNKLNSNAVVTDKITDSAIVTSKIADSAVVTSKINNGAITSEKIESNAKKASNITATTLGTGDTSSGNVQAKLEHLQSELIGMTQGSVADGAITTAKLNDGAVTTDKVADGAITTGKTDFSLFLVPSGGIIMWSGATSSIPSGWYLCNGTNGTPDLRDRFIVGAGNEYAVGDVGGEKEHTLTVDEMPNHSHSYTKEVSDSVLIGVNSYKSLFNSKTTGTTGSTGNDQPHENRPPYYALAFIMKS